MKSTSILLSILASFVLGSCNRQITSPLETATIKGHAWFADSYEAYIPPFNGIKVSLDGTNFSTVTNDSGAYEFDNVPSGTYNVRFTKPGYGEIRWFGKSVQGGGNAPIFWDAASEPQDIYHVPTLYRQPNFVTTLRSLHIEDTTIGQVHEQNLVAEGTYSYNGNYSVTNADIAIYYSPSSDVSSQPGYYSLYYCAGLYGSPWTVDTTLKTFTVSLPLDYVTLNGLFRSGDSLYVAAYGAPPFGTFPPSDYFDPIIENYVLSCLNQTPSPVIGLKIP